MATVNLGRIKPVFRGAYAGGTAYVVDDIVTSGNETFICIQASTGNATSNASYWTKLAAKGADGTDVGEGEVVYDEPTAYELLTDLLTSKTSLTELYDDNEVTTSRPKRTKTDNEQQEISSIGGCISSLCDLLLSIKLSENVHPLATGEWANNSHAHYPPLGTTARATTATGAAPADNWAAHVL